MNHLHQQPRVPWSILTTKINVKNTRTSHIDKKYLWHTVHSKIILSGPTYSSQNVRQIWESTLSKSDYLVGHFGLGRTWEWILKDFFLHFSRWICQTFCDRCVFVSVLSFRVCRMCGYVNTLVYFYLATYSHQER